MGALLAFGTAGNFFGGRFPGLPGPPPARLVDHCHPDLVISSLKTAWEPLAVFSAFDTTGKILDRPILGFLGSAAAWPVDHWHPNAALYALEPACVRGAIPG